MHTAPAVEFPVGPSRLPAAVAAAVWLCTAAVLVVWLLDAASITARHLLALTVALAVAALALRAWRRPGTGVLRWDGQDWWWEADGAQVRGAVALALDLQGCLLLSFDGSPGPRYWLWLERAAEPGRWNALRRAVHAAAPHRVGASGEKVTRP